MCLHLFKKPTVLMTYNYFGFFFFLLFTFMFPFLCLDFSCGDNTVLLIEKEDVAFYSLLIFIKYFPVPFFSI